MKLINKVMTLLFVLSCIASCHFNTTEKDLDIKKVSDEEFKELMGSLEIRTVRLLEIEKGTKAYLLTVEDSVTRNEFCLTSPRVAFYKQHGMPQPNYYDSSDSLYIGGYFRAITSPGSYKGDLSGELKKHIIFDNDTLKSYTSNSKLLPLYHGENTFELLYSMK